ncbi:MAG: hypothetical protein NW226_14765 [Microscillaceae bacterium]|nr:hypothetical protein [Microscillaceae bacterium]
MKFKFCLFGLLILGLGHPIAQSKKYSLQCVFLDQKDEIILRKFSYQKNHTDSLAAVQELNNFLQTLQNQAYWQATAEQIYLHSDSLIAQIRLGERYYWENLKQGNLSPALSAEIGFKEKNYSQQPFIFQDWLDMKDKILDYSENHGLPFASIRLDSIRFQGNKVSAVLNYDPGKEILLDTLILEGNARLRKNFLLRMLNMKNGQLFGQQKVEQANRILSRLPYLQLNEPPSVVFKGELAYVKLNLNRKKSNQIDGILGIFPNESQGKTLITGEFNLDLKNLFASGKNLHIQWQRLQSQSQLLDLHYLHPVILGSKLDFSFDFYLLRQDSSFLNRKISLNIWYNLFDSGKFSLNFTSRRSTLGSENLFREFNSLPEVSEINFFSYGLTYQWNNLDDIFYPSKGIRVDLSLNIGTKNIIPNPFVADSLYEGITLKTTQVLLEGSFEKYFPIGRRFVILTKIRAARIFNKNLFLNELYRLGGIKSLRGHNENSFFASTFTLATLESRWFIDKESYFFLFYDQGFLQRDLIGDIQVDYPLGVGLGVSFSIKAGIFNLVYALGKSNTQEFNFGRSKVHFGLISRF